MKSLSALTLVVIILLSACSKGTSDQTASADSTAAAEATPVDKPVTIVTWNEVGVHETPTEKGKYVTSVYLGEHLELAGDTASEKSGTKRNHYHKVILSDGKQGWVRDEFIGIDVFPAVVMQEAQIMKRPDVATVTEKQFARGDLVVVKNKTGDYLEVTGKISGDKWYTTGYIRSANLSYEEIEVQYASLKRRASEETKQNVKDALMAQLGDGSIFDGSTLYIEDNTDQTPYHSEYNISPLEFEAPPADGLVIRLRLDLNNMEDDSGNGNNATSVGTITSGEDRNGFPQGSAVFDGASYLTVAYKLRDANLMMPFTIAAFLKFDDVRLGNQWILTRAFDPPPASVHLGLNVSDGGDLRYDFGVGRDVVSVEAEIKSGDWTMLAASVDESGHMTLYVNGKLAGSWDIKYDFNADNAQIAGTKVPIEIGHYAGGESYFQGSIADLAIWKRALTAEEIAAMYYE